MRFITDHLNRELLLRCVSSLAVRGTFVKAFTYGMERMERSSFSDWSKCFLLLCASASKRLILHEKTMDQISSFSFLGWFNQVSTCSFCSYLWSPTSLHFEVLRDLFCKNLHCSCKYHWLNRASGYDDHHQASKLKPYLKVLQAHKP